LDILTSLSLTFGNLLIFSLINENTMELGYFKPVVSNLWFYSACDEGTGRII
jgi:hypothetical protein